MDEGLQQSVGCRGFRMLQTYDCNDWRKVVVRVCDEKITYEKITKGERIDTWMVASSSLIKIVTIPKHWFPIADGAKVKEERECFKFRWIEGHFHYLTINLTPLVARRAKKYMIKKRRVF